MAAMPATRAAARPPDGDFLPSICRENQERDGYGNPCPRKTRDQQIVEAKVTAANAYHRFLEGKGSEEEVRRADNILAKVTGEVIGKHDWSNPEDTPAALKLRGKEVPEEYGPLQTRFWPFEQVTWWYCGPATAQSILWYLGPHQSQAAEPGRSDRPWLTGNPFEDQGLLAQDSWLATNRYQGTNWGERYMPFTLNAWRGSSWYIQSAMQTVMGSLSKDMALSYMRYDFDRNYPVAENVIYAPWTYYPFGFWPGIVYMHWDVVYGYVEQNGMPYVQIGQVYHDQNLPYERFQQVAWDVHWSAIEKWHGIVW